MAIKVVGYDGGPFAQYHQDAGGAGRVIRQFLQLILSGNYATNGDTLDLTNAGGVPTAPTTVTPAAGTGVIDIDVLPRSTSPTSLIGAGGDYIVVAPNADAPLKFSDLANLKLKVFKNTAGSVQEYPAGAYGADVLADVIIIQVDYAR